MCYSFLLGKHKAAIEVYNEAARLNQKDWVKVLALLSITLNPIFVSCSEKKVTFLFTCRRPTTISEFATSTPRTSRVYVDPSVLCCNFS